MAIPVHVLILDGSQADADLMVHELRQAGFDPAWQRVVSETDFLTHLYHSPAPDLILSDYTLPQFDVTRALQWLREQELDIPLILVAGNISEDIAVAAMREGAADYLLKGRLARLGPAVASVLDQKRLRGEKRHADQTLEVSEERFRALIEYS